MFSLSIFLDHGWDFVLLFTKEREGGRESGWSTILSVVSSQDESAKGSMFIDCVKNFVFVWECWWHCYCLPEWTVMTWLIRYPAEHHSGPFSDLPLNSIQLQLSVANFSHSFNSFGPLTNRKVNFSHRRQDKCFRK